MQVSGTSMKHTVVSLFVNVFNPILYGGGGANLSPKQFFATVQKRLVLDC